MKQGTTLIRFVVGLMFCVIIAYLVLSWVKTYTDPYKLVYVYTDVIENSTSVQGWIFRDEVVLDGASGLIDYNLDEGEKAANGQVVAVAYQSEDALNRQQRIETIETQLDQLFYAIRDEKALDGVNLETQLIATITSLQSTTSQGEFSRLYSQVDEYKKMVLRREELYGGAEAHNDLLLAYNALDEQMKTLQNYSSQGSQAILATATGTFSSYTDGYETVFVPEELEEITVSDFRRLVSRPAGSTGNSVGKIASSSIWYFTMVVPENQLGQFRAQSQVSVRFSTLADTVPMSVDTIGYVEDGEAVVVLSSRRNMAETISLRQQTCTIIFQSEEGIRIPQKALREEEGDYFVYTVTGYRAEARRVRVLAEDSDYYIVEANPRNELDKRILRSGDEVIVTTAELFEGKVVR